MREKAITRTSIIGIITNLFLVAFKMGAGLIAGSIAIVLDAVNNLTDAMSSIITIAGVKLARRHPSDKHPFGFGRVEYFSTILIALIILSAGVTSLIESVKKIFAPELPDYSAVTIIIVVASVITKLLLGRFVKAQGEKYHSDALVASGADASFDAIISASTLLAAAAALIFKLSIDGVIGAIISVFILKAGFEMLMDAISNVVGSRPDSETTREIKKAVASVPGVIGAYDLVLHNYGPDAAIGTVHVEIPAEMTAAEVQNVTVHIQQTIEEQFNIFLTVGIYAIDTRDEKRMEMRSNIRSIAVAREGAVNAHGIYINEADHEIRFDTTADFTVRDKDAFARAVADDVKAAYPEYKVNVSIDTNYSD